MLKWLKNAWPWKSKSMTAEEIMKSWADFQKEPKAPIWPKDFKTSDVKVSLDKQAPKISDLPNVIEETRKPKPALKKATTRSKTMPLVKSAKPAAFKKNIATSVKEGKPVKQAVAISYAVKKEATKAKSKKK